MNDRRSKNLQLGFWTLRPGVSSAHIRWPVEHGLAVPLERGDQGTEGLGYRDRNCGKRKCQGVQVRLECTGQVLADRGDQNQTL